MDSEMNNKPGNPKIHVFGADHVTNSKVNEGLTFECTSEDFYLIGKITQRCYEMAKAHGVEIDYMICQMDITACHCNGTPLKLLQLLMSDNGDFAHDFCGIGNNIDRSTGKLLNFFVPRFSLKMN